MKNLNFDNQIIKAVHKINFDLLGECVFAGSFGLKYNGLIDRVIGDLDVFTEYKMYGTEESESLLKRNEQGSEMFYVGNMRVYCVHGESEGIPVDFLYRTDELKYEIVNFHGVNIKIELPEFAINAKKEYIKSNPQTHKASKHIQDLRKIDPEWRTFPEIENDDIAF